MQAEAQIPILGSSESDIQGFFTPILHLCNDFWGQLLEQICQKPGHEPKLAKAAVEGIISELAALLPHAEWPGAHVLLHVLCKCLVDVLHTGKGASGGLEISREDRELLLDVAGFLVARVCPCPQCLHDVFFGDAQPAPVSKPFPGVYQLILHCV